MNCSVTTVYDYDCLIEFNYFVSAGKKLFWTLMSVSTVIISIAFIIALALGEINYFISISFALVVLLDAFYLIFYFVYPRFAVRRMPTLNMNVCYDFDENGIKVASVGENYRETSELSYSCIKKVEESQKYIYVFISNVQAYIVSKAGFSAGSPETLKCLFMSRGIKYKD